MHLSKEHFKFEEKGINDAFSEAAKLYSDVECIIDKLSTDELKALNEERREYAKKNKHI